MKAEDLLGRTIAGYALYEILGRGGMSIVFIARRLENPEDQVAIKILVPPELATAGEFASFQARFLREARAVHQLHHPHILPVFEYGEEDGLFYMTMPYISGGTLAHRLDAATEPMPLDEIAGFLAQLASAVDYANQHGMVHRDIKPSNVLIDERGNVYLTDFGIMRLFESEHLSIDESPTTLTTTGKMYGTPAYMAPERYIGEPARPATDMYGLGVLLYQLVTGQLPFTADNPVALGMKHIGEDPPRPRSLRPDLPEPAEAAILKALAKKPEDRFASAAALAAAFETGLKGQWVEGLLPLPAVLAVSEAETQLQPLVPVPGPIVPMEAHQPERLVLGPAPEAPSASIAPAFVPTTVNKPVAARPVSRPQRDLRIVALAALAVALLAFIGVLAFLIYKTATPPTSGPGSHPPVPTSTASLPTRSVITPIPSLGATHTPSPGSAPTPTPTVIPSPSPTPSPSPSPTLSPSPSPSPTPTPSPSPMPSPSPSPALSIPAFPLSAFLMELIL